MHIKRENVRGFIDASLIFIVTSFFSIVAAGYFISGFTKIIAAGLTGGVSLTALILMAQKKRKPLDNPEIKRVLTHLVFSSEADNHKYIKEALKTRYTVRDKKTFLMINRTAVFVRLKKGKLTESVLADIYGKARSAASKIVILTVDGGDNICSALITALPGPKVTIFDGEQVYRLLRWLGSLPKVEIELKKNKRTIKDFFINALHPQRARGYFFTAFMLILPSMLFSRSLYYIITAFICIILGTAAKLDVLKKLSKNKN